MPFDLANYEPVEDRIRKFWADHPLGRVATEMVFHAPGEYVVKASIFRVDEREPWATGHAHEAETAKGVNSTSALENCETSAIGRALANGGYAAKGARPSREEMEKVDRGPVTRGAGGSVRKASEAQLKKITHLVQSTGELPSCGWPPPDDLSMRDASRIIDELEKAPKEPKAERRGPDPAAVAALQEQLASIPAGEEPF